MLGRLSFAIAVGALLVGCTSAPPAKDDEPAAPSAPAQPQAPSAEPEPAPAPPAAPVEVPETPPAPELPVGPSELATGMSNGAFDDTEMQARPQVTVTWTNEDGTAHSVLSDDGRFAGSGPISPGMSFTRTFLTPGEYAFHCGFHPDMKGTLTVA